MVRFLKNALFCGLALFVGKNLLERSTYECETVQYLLEGFLTEVQRLLEEIRYSGLHFNTRLLLTKFLVALAHFVRAFENCLFNCFNSM